MKKIYLCAIALSLGSFSFGQYAKQSSVPFRAETNNSIKTAKPASQDKGTVIWSDQFNTPANWVMANTGTPSRDWTIGQSASGSGGFPLADLLSTSGAPFALFDSDAGAAGNVQDATITTASPISCTGYPDVSVVFENYFRPFSTTAIYVEVSTDGVTFPNQYQVHAAVPVNGATLNPELTSVNISAAAGNQPAVWIRFRYTGEWDYGWAIDDVELQVTDDNDLTVFEEYYGTGFVPYTRIPVAQIQPIDFAMKATNIGAVAQTNSVLTADINGGLWTGTSAPVTIAPGATDSLFTTTQFTPPTTLAVAYTATLSVASDSVDASPGNNSFTFPPFEVSQYIYAQDDHGTPGAGGGSTTNPTFADEFEAGCYYDVFTATQAYGIDVVIGAGTTIGGAYEVVLYDITTGSFVEVDRSVPIVVNSGDIGQKKTLPLPAQPALTAGSFYFAAVHAFGGGNEFFYGVSGSSPGNPSAGGPTCLIFYPSMTAPNTGQNFYTTQTPMIRLNFDPSVGVENVESNTSFSVYPNPSAGLFNLNLDAKDAGNVNLIVKNVVGQTIIDKTITVAGKTKETISLANYSKGVYFLTIDSKTVKLVVE